MLLFENRSLEWGGECQEVLLGLLEYWCCSFPWPDRYLFRCLKLFFILYIYILDLFLYVYHIPQFFTKAKTHRYKIYIYKMIPISTFLLKKLLEHYQYQLLIFIHILKQCVVRTNPCLANTILCVSLVIDL